MARRLFVHIGTPKSATTYLQDSLWANRVALQNGGLLIPVPNQGTFWRVAVHVRSFGVGGRTFDDTYERLLRRTKRWDGDVIITSEVLCASRTDQARQFVEDMGFDEVHVIVTARDFARQVTAEWQQHVKAGLTASLPEFLSDIRDERRRTWFWLVQDLVRIVETWRPVVPISQIHVVTVPKDSTDPALIWRRFLSVLDLDQDRYLPIAKNSNVSLDYEQVEVLRRFTGWRVAHGVVPGSEIAKLQLSRPMLDSLRAKRGSKIFLTREVQDWAVATSKAMAADLAATGVSICGSIDDLISDFSASSENDPPAEEEVFEAMSRMLEGTLLREHQLKKRVNDQVERLRVVKTDLVHANTQLQERQFKIEDLNQELTRLNNELLHSRAIRSGVRVVVAGIKRRVSRLFRRSAA